MIEQKEHFHGSDLEKIEEYYGISKDKIISFSANVNPLGVSPKLRKELTKQIDAITTYPDREYSDLRKAIASYCNCNFSQVIVGNGCTELISLFIEITSPKQTLLLGPTYSEYERELTKNKSTISTYLLKKENNFELDTADFTNQITKETDLVIICNPNNPTSSCILPEEMSQILDHCKSMNCYVMVDETYMEFTDQKYSSIPFIKEYDNLIILRGTSKFFAAPGLRLGYGLTGNENLLLDINKNKNPWMINSLAVVAGITMFQDESYIKKTRTLCKKEMHKLEKAFQNSGKFKVYPAYGNFLLLEIIDKNVTSFDLFEKAIKEGLMIRDCSTFESLGQRFIRICFMDPKSNKKLIDCLTK